MGAFSRRKTVPGGKLFSSFSSCHFLTGKTYFELLLPPPDGTKFTGTEFSFLAGLLTAQKWLFFPNKVILKQLKTPLHTLFSLKKQLQWLPLQKKEKVFKTNTEMKYAVWSYQPWHFNYIAINVIILNMQDIEKAWIYSGWENCKCQLITLHAFL